MLHQLGLNSMHARFHGLAGGLCRCFAGVSMARYASSGRIASNIAQLLGNYMTSDKYAKIVFDDGVIHVIPVWDDALTTDELINHAIQAGLDYNACEFTITVVHT